MMLTLIKFAFIVIYSYQIKSGSGESIFSLLSDESNIYSSLLNLLIIDNEKLFISLLKVKGMKHILDQANHYKGE